MIAEAGLALSGLKTAYDIAKGMQTLHTSTEVREATSEMLDTLLTVRRQMMEAAEREDAVLKQVGDLEAEIARLKAWDGEKHRYQMKRYHPGVIAYALKEGMEGDEKAHRLCAGCYQNGIKGYLQATAELDMRDRVHVCTSCRVKTPLGREEEG